MNYSTIEEKLGYVFTDRDLLLTALTHRSCSSKHNQRLEFLGDSILNFIISEYVFCNFSLDEGGMSLARAHMVQTKSLLALARHLNLGDSLVCAKNILQITDSMMVDAMEAIIAAIYLDSSFMVTKNLVLALYAKNCIAPLNNSEMMHPQSVLQEKLSKHFKTKPSYSVESADQGCFRITLTVPHLQKTYTITTSSVKEGKTQLAHLALQDIA